MSAPTLSLSLSILLTLTSPRLSPLTAPATLTVLTRCSSPRSLAPPRPLVPLSPPPMEMEAAVAAASDFLSSYLPSSEHGAAVFRRELQSTLSARYSSHWHAHQSERGSAYRALMRTQHSLDHSIIAAALAARLSPRAVGLALVSSAGAVPLGLEWTLWVDPAGVTLRIDSDSHKSSSTLR